MKNKLLRFLTTSLYNIIYKDFFVKNSILGIITPPKRVNVKILNGQVKNMKIENSGKNNKMLLDRCCIYSSCKIVFQGNNNFIVINKGCKLSNLLILIRGNNCKVEIGADTTSNGTSMYCIGEGHVIRVGKDCMFAKGTELWSSDSHTILSAEPGSIINNQKHDVIIGDHVWLAEYAKILKGVMVAENCVIGMCAVLTKSTVPNGLYGGIPAIMIKQGITWKR